MLNRDQIIFLDTETTGMGKDSRLCQVAYKFGGQEFEALFKPPVPIEIEAMAISHITNKMVADKEPFLGSLMHQVLGEIFSQKHILVAHNAAFDVQMLEKENLAVQNIIDTFKIVHHLDQQAEIPQYNLQYLRYYFDLEVENAVAHNALGDVRVLEKLFELLFEKMRQGIQDETAVLQKMLEISSQPVLIRKFKFGKYNGQSIEAVAKKDRGYLQWLLKEKEKTKSQGDEQDRNWIYTLQHYLK